MGIIVFIFWIIFFFLKFILCVFCVFIICVVLFIKVGIKCKFIDSINLILWIGIFIFFKGVNRVLIVDVKFKGMVVKVNKVEKKIINIKW